MKIRISDISADGLHVSDTIPLEPLNDRMSEGRDHGIRFIEAPVVNLHIRRSGDGAETKGNVKSRYKQPCGMCAKEVEKDVEVEANFIIKKRASEKGQAKESEGEGLDDIGIIYYQGEHVDLEDVIQETLILALSIYWHPPEDEAGSCVRCGLKFEQQKGKELGCNLGALLKKAGV